jgi:CRISPR-associated endonuclease/helicase Cas3
MNSYEEIAHVAQNIDGTWSEPQSLLEHLEGTALLTLKFSKAFKSSSWGNLAGLAHDLGKSTTSWQKYIREKSGYEAETDGIQQNRIDHSSPSALLIEQLYPNHVGRILSYIIAGHHTGLPDWQGTTASLQFRLQQAISSASEIPNAYKEIVKNISPSQCPWLFDPNGLDFSLWIRMLFSSLVDADFLDTERYMINSSFNLRGKFSSIEQLFPRFNKYMAKLHEDVTTNGLSRVNQMRQQVLSDCRNAAKLAPGFFSLTVPTGGGKTLSSLGFALEHAKQYDKKRIIYVIPYTSIIEQTADVFRSVLGDDEVIEHQSNFDTDFTSKEIRLASENWDAPVVVTTNVQFLESLFATRPGRCRKLHNIVESVVIFDEAQLLPTDYLIPVLESLKQLVAHYETSIVFCTATQPAFNKTPKFPSFPGFEKGLVREIIRDVPALYKALQRVEIEPCDPLDVISWSNLATTLSSYDKVLCIVSDRKSCRELYNVMPTGTIHLSALMCPQHRSNVIAQIKQDLKTNKPVRVISTQLVEAGVDIDFPVVYRALAGMDSIAQAAGRCNREGRLVGTLGKVVLFTPPRKPPVGILRKATEITCSFLKRETIDFLDPSSYEKYFTELYWKSSSLDSKDIMSLLKPEMKTLEISFRTAAENFKLIDDSNTESILIPYAEGKSLIKKLRYIDIDEDISARGLFRKLQRYSVTIYKNQFQALLARGSLIEVYPKVYALECDVEYKETVGLLIDELPNDPMSYIG